MSTDADKGTACPNASEKQITEESAVELRETSNDAICEKKRQKPPRSVSFPDEDHLVTQYFEPANPWQDVPSTTRAQLAAEYLESCRRHNTPPIESVLQQIRELPENAIGGSIRAPRLTLSECVLLGSAPADALEAVLRKTQFRRIELDHAAIDDEGAEAIFDMIEYYESATAVCISGPRQYGVRGWQAASRMIKKSAELSELEVTESPLEASHAPVLARALRSHTCRVTWLCLQRADLAGEPLLCLVIALKSNNSVRELRLGDNRLSVSDAAQLGSLLRFNTRLQLLDLSNNQIQDAGVGHIADALVEQAAQTPPSAAASPISPHHCPLTGGYEARGLAFLVLWNNQLTRNCATHLSKALRSSQSLCVLNIGRNSLGSECIRALQSGSWLISVGLQAAKLGADAARAIADLVGADTSLQRLDLRDNKLGAAGLQAILSAMKENTTLTQIDLDDPTESTTLTAEDGEAATIARLTREIRAQCRRNEPNAGSPLARVHRKISLTCHTVCLTSMSVLEEDRRGSGRLRSPLPSPAPSPAGSPVPAPHHSRFSVTRVTPERESSTESSSPSTPTRPTYCPTPSRFRVVQVAEPPQIQIQPASQPRRSTSRFSVTRNYDTIYNTALASSNKAIDDKQNSTLKEVASMPDLTSQIDILVGNEPVLSTSVPVLATVPGLGSGMVIVPATSVPVTSVTPAKETNLTSVASVPLLSNVPIISTSVPTISTSVLPVSSAISSSSVPLVSTSTTLVSSVPLTATVPLISTNVPISTVSTSVPQISTSTAPITTLISKAIPILTTSIPLMPNVSPMVSVSTNTESISEDVVPHIEISQCISKCTESDKVVSLAKPTENVISSTQVLPMSISSDLSKHCDSNLTTVAATVPKESKGFEVNKECLDKTNVAIDSVLKGIENMKIEVQNTRSDVKIDKDIDKTSDSVCDAKKETKKTGDASEKDAIISEISKIVKDKTYSDVVKSDKCFRDTTESVSRETVSDIGDGKVKTETKLIKNTVEASEKETLDVKVEVTVKKEKPAKAHTDQTNDFRNIDDITINKKDTAMKQIEAITEDLGNLIEEMRELSTKTCLRNKDDLDKLATIIVPANIVRDNVVLKKNKSESSLDSPDLEVSRLMNKKLTGGAFCDSSSSLEISGSSVESLNALDNQNVHNKPIIIQESVESDIELDRRKPDHVVLSTESSIESTSEVTPVNSGNFLNMSVSSNESVSPIIFGRSKKIHDSLSSLEASVSSLDSGRQEKIMVTSADSGIEYSLQNPSENKDDNSSNEGTLTNNSSLKESVRKPENLQDTLTSSPKRTSSLLDVPALKSKGLDRMRKISWVAPSPSFHIPRPEAEKETKLPSHLEKLLSLFQHPSSLFSRGSQSDDERKSASNTPPRKDSSLTSSFWSWGSTTEKEKEERAEDSSSEATDSTLSERVQISFVDESFSKKLDSKTPSTDTDNTLSEFQSFPTQVSESESQDRGIVTDVTTDELVQNVDLSVKNTETASSDRACDMKDLIKPNDLNKNVCDTAAGDANKNKQLDEDMLEVKLEETRPRSFAAVLKSSGSENSLEKQSSPEGQPVNKLPSKVIRGIKENISPENTLTSSMSNTKALALELTERQVKNQPIINTVFVTPLYEKEKRDDSKSSDLAPIATIEETEELQPTQLDFIDDAKFDEKNASLESVIAVDVEKMKAVETSEGNVDLGKDALSYLVYENKEFKGSSLAQELKEAGDQIDLSPELIIDEAIEVPEVFTAKEVKGLKTSPVIPERAKIKKSNSLEELPQMTAKETKGSPKTKTIAFKVPESTPRDIPVRPTKLRTRSGSSPKSLPDSLNKPCPLTKMDSILSKKKKKVSSLGKMAKDSLLALNMSEEEIAEFRRSYKLTSVESLKSLESVSEDANSQSGNSVDYRCRACLRTSQESLMSLDSITEDCKCGDDCDRPGHSAR